MSKIMEFVKQNLKVKVFETRDEMGMEAALDAKERINELLINKEIINIIFAAAPSQNDFLKHLLKEDIDWTRIQAFHMDEYIGLDKDAPQGFGNFLNNAIFSKLPFRSINYINGQAENLQNECDRYSRLLKQFPPDIVFMGIGENGHLAFNDPHVADFNDPYMVKVVDLDDVCRKQQVNDGCFKTINDVPKKAFTLTMSMLLNIDDSIIVVPSKTKKNAVYETIMGDVSTKCPASILRQRSGSVLYTDKDSASLILK